MVSVVDLAARALLEGPPDDTTVREPPMITISPRAAHLAQAHLGITVPVLALTLVAFTARVRVRVFPSWRVRADDWLIALGFASAITDWALLMVGMVITPGSIPSEHALYATKLSYFAVAVWGLTMVTVKTSICLTLLRIPQAHVITISLYLVMVCQILYFILNTMYTFTKCRPLRAAWASTAAGGRCVDPSIDVIVSNVGSGVNITTDLFLSLAPMFILWNLRRPLRERILVCILTGIGLIASLATIRKMMIMKEWGQGGNIWEFAMSISTWTVLEQFMGILAACSPSLKGPIQKLLARYGVLLTRYDNNISFITIPHRNPCGPHGSIYDRQADAEVGGYPGLIRGDVDANQIPDMPGAGEMKGGLTSPSRSTLQESVNTVMTRGEVSQDISTLDKT
ncbi:hypothetical protein QBC37DRAFT_424738 [Rhypophila decipiens]|uniref:Rhodopsin domain-containing protein n=1 Tax=Rhypophila decipiens TaxID=261697 RepID=A0AAN6Y5G9_9PEZI|nr:hypothetical protein QBC37DRAFT_424738 [Rhypophila decipiens]